MTSSSNVKTDYVGGATVCRAASASAAGCGHRWRRPVLSDLRRSDLQQWRRHGLGDRFPGRDRSDLIVSDSDAVTNDSNLFDVVPGDLDRFLVASIPSSQTAGVAFDVTATAYDAYGNIKTNYLGGATVNGTLGSAPGFLASTSDDIGPSYGLFSAGAWTSGMKTAQVTAYLVETGRTVTVSDSGKTGTSNAFDVVPGDLDRFLVASIPSSQTAGVAFDVTATAYDAYGNIKTNYLGGATVNGTLGSAPGFLASTSDDIGPSYGLFSAGAWTSGYEDCPGHRVSSSRRVGP